MNDAATRSIHHLLGMAKVVSEDAVRRALSKIAVETGRGWVQEQLDYCTRPLLREHWILDVDTTVKPLYGHQEGAVRSPIMWRSGFVVTASTAFCFIPRICRVGSTISSRS